MILISKTYWLGLPFNYKGELPVGVYVKPLLLKSEDMRELPGLCYEPAEHTRQNIAVLVMHPRADFSRHYCIPALLEAGIACLGLSTRCLNNDATAIHEDLILDVNAGVRFMKQSGYEKVVLFGNSGGASLFSLFQSQARLPKGKRIAKTPGGDRTRLNIVDMVPADGLAVVSGHPGEGHVMNSIIDPAVVDESNPLLTDESLDMYRTANGFAPPPEPSSYSTEFVKRYRIAQKDRVARLDSLAQAMIDDAHHNERLYDATEDTLSFGQRQNIGRRGSMEKVMTIYRTMANLNYTDPDLDPSRRAYGSLFSDRPDLMNMQFLGFGRICRPEAWLSTWSGRSSNANMLKTLPQLTDIPVLMVFAQRDREIFPKSDARPMWEAVAAKDKTYMEVDAEHYFEPEFGAKTAPDVEKVMADVVPWVLERFGG